MKGFFAVLAVAAVSTSCGDLATTVPSARSVSVASHLDGADTSPPTVTIFSPASGQTCRAFTPCVISWSSVDNVGVASHNIQLAIDGVTFNTTLATGLSGGTDVFSMTTPNVGTTTAAIRVQSVDAAGNIGSATVGDITFLQDVVPPTVTVFTPQGKDKLDAGSAFLVTWTSSDNIGVISHQIDYSADAGETFTPLVTGIPGNVQSSEVVVPDGKKDAVFRVSARDANGNVGSGNSGVFSIKKARK